VSKELLRQQAKMLSSGSIKLIEQILIKSNQGVISGALEAVQKERIETLQEVFKRLDEMHMKCDQPNAIHKGCRMGLGSAMDMVKELLDATSSPPTEPKE